MLRANIGSSRAKTFEELQNAIRDNAPITLVDDEDIQLSLADLPEGVSHAINCLGGDRGYITCYHDEVNISQVHFRI